MSEKIQELEARISELEDEIKKWEIVDGFKEYNLERKAEEIKELEEENKIYKELLATKEKEVARINKRYDELFKSHGIIWKQLSEDEKFKATDKFLATINKSIINS